MRTLQVSLASSPYQIVIGHRCLSDLGTRLKRLGQTSQVIVVTAPPIGRRYGRAVMAALAAAGHPVHLVTVPDGERTKSLRWLSHLYDRLIQLRCDRNTTVVALGGGVIGDLAGMAASTYLRGVNVIHVPTTLVAQVDASIGGKTGVNHPRGKNLIGTFYQPKLVFIDVAALRTLPGRELIGGLSEVVKYGVISDPGLFAYLERHADDAVRGQVNVLERIVYRSARIKAGVVARDEREGGLRRILNYGHTLGHAIEAATGYGRYHHGEAIAIGMEFAARLSGRLGLCPPSLLDRQRRLFERIGLPTQWPPRISMARVAAAMALDKKMKGGRIHFVLPTRVGEVTVMPVEPAIVNEVLRNFSKDQ